MKNRPEEPDSWDVIDNLAIKVEQQSFLLVAAVAFSFLESYERNWKTVRITKWEYQRIDWNEHVTKLLHENRVHREYHMSLEALNKLLELLRHSVTVNVVKYNASSGLYSSKQHIYPELILAIELRWLSGGNLIDICHVY
jgi:hypothetical protein